MTALLLCAVGGAVGAGLVLVVVVVVVAAVGPWLPLGTGDPYEGDADEVEVWRRG